MQLLPLFFDLKARACLIVGGGVVAARKARLLNKAGAEIHVVAPQIGEELQQLASQVAFRGYHSDDLQHKILVICATDSESVNRQVAADCHARQLPVNVVDNPKLCSVVVPAIVDRSPLVVGICSGGESPVLARKVRTQLESTLPGAYGDLGKFASDWRQQVKNRLPDEDQRRRFWEEIIDGSVGEMVLSGKRPLADSAIEERLQNPDESRVGEVYLVGAGPGDPDLLTFKALRLMQKAEVVLYDRLVSPPILEMVRRDAERIFVGKQRDKHAVQQADLNEMLLHIAQSGKRVLRLKGGDPFIFGRGGEEIELLAQHRVPFQVVPGITAASGCSCYAGIPLTHRDYSQSVRFITGHSQYGESNLAWKEFIDSQQTLVFYMGLSGLHQICNKLIEYGKPSDTPAALVERGTLPDQKIHLASIEELPALVDRTDIRAPTLLIIGDVVKLRDRLNV